MPLTSELKYFLHIIAFILWISLVEIFYGVIPFDFFKKSEEDNDNNLQDFEFSPIEGFLFFKAKNKYRIKINTY